jgi:hypothetical protein
MLSAFAPRAEQLSGVSAAHVQERVPELRMQALSPEEAKPAMERILRRLGLERPEQIADVTTERCIQVAGDDIVQGWALFSTVLVLQAHIGTSACKTSSCVLPPRTEPLPKLELDAYSGDYVAPPATSCPLVLVFDRVEPTTEKSPVKLFIVNRSILDDPKPLELPADLTKAKGGRYSFQADDEFMLTHKIRPGAIIEAYQVKYDEAGKELRRSEPTYRAMTKRKLEGKTIAAPDLPPGDVVGDVHRMGSFKFDVDVEATHVRPDRIHTSLIAGELVITPKGDKPAFEPDVVLQMENLKTRQTGEETEVRDGGSFQAGVKAEDGQPILIRAIDHSHNLGDPLYERRLVLLAGRDSKPMLVRNPALGFDEPPRIASRRISLGGKDCKDLFCDRGVTAGSIVTIRRAVEGRHDKTITLAGPDGSFRAELPFVPHERDVFEVEVRNAYSDIETAPQKAAVSRIRYEVGPEGQLSVVSSEGNVGKKGTCEDGGALPVPEISDKDPWTQGARYAIEDFYVCANNRDPNTGQGGIVRVDVDRRGTAKSFMRVEKDQVVVTLSTDLNVAVTQPPQSAQLGLGSFGSSNRVWGDTKVDEIKKWILGRTMGTEVEVRFRSTDGDLNAEGRLKVELARDGGVMLKLVPGSLRHG